LNVFIGYDPRQPVAYQVLSHSITERSSKPVPITKLRLNQLPIRRRGLTEFTYSRFLVPYLSGFKGWSLFLDADMLLLDDIQKLFDLKDPKYDVMVVKDQQKFEWPSLMLFNNEKCQVLTPDFVDNIENSLFDWSWTGSIGELPREWNHCVGYAKPCDAKLVHFTQGIPCFPETSGCEYTSEWVEDLGGCNTTVPWMELMGNSVHAEKIITRLHSGVVH
jgi:lipopolysaccharide biosynthesis glycosyltransferase